MLPEMFVNGFVLVESKYAYHDAAHLIMSPCDEVVLRGEHFHEVTFLYIAFYAADSS